MLLVAAKISTQSRRPRLIILLDMVACSVIYQAGYLDYQEFEFHSLSWRQRSTWITSGNANSIVLRYNQKQYRDRFSEKPTFNALFAQYLGREWLDVRENTAEELARFVASHGSVMAKQVDGMGGAGIRRISANEVTNADKFHARLMSAEQYLVEELLVQHPDMALLCPTSVNSLRMITFLDGDSVHVMEAVLRMGNGSDVDNYGRGGMYTVIDETTGIAHYGAFDRFANTFNSHPLTATPIVGFQVPLYDRVLRLLDEVARVVPQIPYVGWDVAITADGPVIIEGNYNTGVFQMKPSLTGNKTGLLPYFRSVIDF